MRTKKIMIFGGIAVLCVLILVMVLWKNDENKDKDQQNNDSIGEIIVDQNQDSEESTQKEEQAQSDEQKDSDKEDVKDGKNESKGPTFPYAIPNTNLVVQKFSEYDGVYFEDGSDVEVKDVSAMLVTNAGDKEIEYAEITVKNGTQQMMFKVSTLPAGKTVVVQESNQAAYQDLKDTNFHAECVEVDALEMSEGKIKVEETRDGGLIVTNLTDKDIPCVRLFYKFYMEEEDIFVGGITYVSKVTGLAAKSSQEVTPKHYAVGSSKIMMIRTYETAE